MKKLPVIIERTNTQLRVMAFKVNAMAGNIDQTRSYLFENTDFETQNEEMNFFIREHFFDNAGIYINVPIEELILREFSLPFIARGKIKDLLPFELESHLPYEISEIFYDYHAYPDEAQKKTNVIVAACKKKFLEQYIPFFLKNNHELKGIYIPIDSLLHLSSYLEKPSATEEPSGIAELSECILYMSGNFSIYFIVKQGKWQFSRVVPIGYDKLFADISKKWKKDTQESKKILTEIPFSDSEIVDFEYYKQKFKLSKVKSMELVDTITKFGHMISHELKSTIVKYYQDTSKVNNLVLMSDLENQVFLENILADKIPLTINPFPYGRTPVSIIGRQYIIPAGMAYAIPSNRYLNLMDANLKKLFKKKKDHGDRLMAAILIFSILLFAGSFVVNVMQKKKHYNIIQMKRKELFTSLFNKNPDDQVSMSTQAAQLVEEQKKRSEIYKLQSNKMKLSKILFELNKSLIKSGSLQVERFVYTNNIVNILGTADDFNELNNIKNLVLGNPVFSTAEMKDQRSYPGADGRNRVRFNLIVKPATQED
jgi:Tfp pilus assembly PilM family ATPase